MRLFRWLLYIFSLAVMVAFTVVNNHFITLSFFPLPYEVDLPLYILILGLFLSGAVVGHLATYRDRIMLRSVLRKKERMIIDLKQQLESIEKRMPEGTLIEHRS